MSIFTYLIIVLCSLFWQSWAWEPSDEIIPAFLNSSAGRLFANTIIREIYEDNKLQQIAEVANITLVGSQNIYKENGDISEIRTVELHWPKLFSDEIKDKLAWIFSENDGDEKSAKNELRTLLDTASTLGYQLSLKAEEFNKEGEIVKELHMAKNLMCEYSDGFHVINRTIELDSPEAADKEIIDLGRNRSLSLHKFDDKRQFIAEGSKIVPEYLATIISEDGQTSPKLLREILAGFSTLFLENEGDSGKISAKLVEYLEEKHPKKEFYVFSNEPAGWYLPETDFFKVAIQFNVNNWSDGADIYTVYGTKRI